jgi:DNA ligase-associated metallophosphoesterase
VRAAAVSDEAALVRHQGEAAISVAGAGLVATVDGALVWPEEATLIVADLHLEKGSAFAARGVLLPPYDTAATLARLARLIARHTPRRVVFLGDTFHDRRAEERITGQDREALMALLLRREAVFIAGNHDPAAPRFLDIDEVAELAVGPLTFRHEPLPGAQPGEIAGHLHPVARVAARGRSLRRRCFVGDGTRLVMPALGAFAGGLNVRDAAFRQLFPKGFTAHLMGDEKLFAFTRSQCLGG